jgi:hypothetical protein
MILRMKARLPLGLAIAISAPAIAKDSIATNAVSVPFTIEQIFGARPVVAATINGKPYRLVLHANAGSYLQINHAEASNVDAHDLKHVGAYGISAPGKVSGLGRDNGYVDRVKIGEWNAPSVPVAVFEVPAGGSEGMLGLPFLHDNSAILDFAEHKLRLSGAAPSRSLAAEMAKRGYSAHPMIRDPQDGRFLVRVNLNDAQAMMVVSTVATVDIDAAYAERAKVSIGQATGNYGGPSGATGKVCETATPVSLYIGNWASKPAKVSVEDTYAYSKAPRPADAEAARGGELGADFMIANEAVIDFGNAVLYLKN